VLVLGAVPVASAATPVVLTTTASAGAGAGEVFATATLSGGDDPTGTVTFRLFGPGDDACGRAPVFTSVAPVIGDADPKQATSGHVVLAAPGIYHFVASYSGDARNAAVGPTGCGDPDAAVGFGSSSFSFSARASGPAVVGDSLSDAATVTTTSDPTGTMTFALFGPDAAGCSSPPVFTSTVPVQGDGTYTSGGYVAARPGAYRWVAAYSGDADDPGAATACEDPSQRVDVAAAAAGPKLNDRCAPLAAPRGQLEARMAAAYGQLIRAFGGPSGVSALAQLQAYAAGELDRALATCRAALPSG
jgi:hypothetical protein